MKRFTAVCIVFLFATILLSGCFHTHKWQDATCTEPVTCSCGETLGDPLGHDNNSATCDEPTTCSVCGETEGEPLDHTWLPATCKNPSKCARCGSEIGVALYHDWTEATEATPKTCSTCGDMEPSPLPENGKVFIGSNLSRHSTLTVRDENLLPDNLYIKLKTESGEDAFSFFVRPPERSSAEDYQNPKDVTISVPKGKYYIYVASGKDWYGTETLFGFTTEYLKFNDPVDFSNYTCTITLKQVFSYDSDSESESSSISASDF